MEVQSEIQNDSEKQQRASYYKPTTITSPIYWIPQQTTLGKRFWSFIKWMKKDNVGISSLKR